MPDPFDDIDPGEDFERYAVGLKPVTVKRVDPDSGDALDTVEEVPATKLIRRRSPFSAAGGELGGDTTEFVFRASRLADADGTRWLPKPRDQIVDAAGLTWDIESAALEAFDTLCRAQAVIKRG